MTERELHTTSSDGSTTLSDAINGRVLWAAAIGSLLTGRIASDQSASSYSYSQSEAVFFFLIPLLP